MRERERERERDERLSAAAYTRSEENVITDIQGGRKTTAISTHTFSLALVDIQSSYFRSLKFEVVGLVWCIKV